MKKLLIIQLDDAYFLFETLQVIERNQAALKDFSTTVLVSEVVFKNLGSKTDSIITGITFDSEEILKQDFDISINLSLKEDSWHLHGNINSKNKIGSYYSNGQLFVNDLWSSYLLTLKAKAPFLTFHMQQIYQNIIGIKSVKPAKSNDKSINRIAFSATNINVFSGHEQEKMIEFINHNFPNISIFDISEIDPISDLSQTLYIGPTNLEAVELCEFGARGIFLGSHFQGFNLLPYKEGSYFISSKGDRLLFSELQPFFKSILTGNKLYTDIAYPIYATDEENLFGGYLRSLNKSDDNYPFYQAHVVLWNFLLNLFDTNLEIISCSQSQLKILNQNKEVLSKLIRLYEYATVAIDTILNESKVSGSSVAIVTENIKQLEEIESISDQIAQSHSFLRPFLDFYRIRRGQNHGVNLTEQSQHTFLLYSEELQALKALEELISVTLLKNEVSI